MDERLQPISNCATHHYACDCREAMQSRLVAAAIDLDEALCWPNTPLHPRRLLDALEGLRSALDPYRRSTTEDEWQYTEEPIGVEGVRTHHLERALHESAQRRKLLEEALKTIRGPSDGGPFIGIFRDAGGGYEGLQAVAAAALEANSTFRGADA